MKQLSSCWPFRSVRAATSLILVTGIDILSRQPHFSHYTLLNGHIMTAPELRRQVINIYKGMVNASWRLAKLTVVLYLQNFWMLDGSILWDTSISEIDSTKRFQARRIWGMKNRSGRVLQGQSSLRRVGFTTADWAYRGVTFTDMLDYHLQKLRHCESTPVCRF